MLFDKIQSGFLLFETPQGLTRIELSPRQRVSLLWTFRNFRQLSMPLLNPRERELVNSLFRNSAPVMLDDQDPGLVIGVVENFVPPTPRIQNWPIQKPAAPRKIEQETVVANGTEIDANPVPTSLIPARLKLRTVEAKTSELADALITPVRLTTTSRKTTKRATTKLAKLATSLAALCLCLGSVAAWHRIQGLPVSQDYSRPPLEQTKAMAAPTPSNAAEEETRGESRITQNTHADAPTPFASGRTAAPEAALRQAAITAVAPAPTPTATPIASPVSTPKRALRVHPPASTTNLPLSAEDAGIQASRPPLHFVYPDYSDVRARGVVSLKAGLDSAGNVRTVKLISGNRALAAAALRAVRKWHYRPYLKDGKPVATETYIVISFISEDAVSMSFPPSVSAAR